MASARFWERNATVEKEKTVDGYAKPLTHADEWNQRTAWSSETVKYIRLRWLK